MKKQSTEKLYYKYYLKLWVLGGHAYTLNQKNNKN